MRRLNHTNYYELSHVSSEDVYETPNEPLKTLVKQLLQTRQVHEELHTQLGALGQKYIYMLLGDREKAIDYIYGVYLSENGNKYLDIDTNNFVIVNGVQRYTWFVRINFQKNS